MNLDKAKGVATLNYEHWRDGEVEREVCILSHWDCRWANGAKSTTARYVCDRARVYMITFKGDVYSAGRVIGNEATITTPLRIGWGAKITAEEAA